MKKILALLLVLVLSFSAIPAFATSLVKSFNFEGFENDASAQNTSDWTWITLNQWEFWYTDAKFVVSVFSSNSFIEKVNLSSLL